jgi:hypothetical protein
VNNNYHAWATRNNPKTKRIYTMKEHAIYIAISILGIACCVAVFIWAVETLGRVFLN